MAFILLEAVTGGSEGRSLISRTSTDLLEALKNPANQTAWGEFDQRYRPLVLAVARRLGLNQADAEDAAQETLAAFVEAYSRGQYDRPRGRLRDFLRGVACHKVRDIQRRSAHREKRFPHRSDQTDFMATIPDGHIETVWDYERSNAVLRQCLQEVQHEVSPQTYQAFELTALRQWEAKRAAKHLGISLDVVYQSKHRVLQRIRQLLPEMDDAW
jgi:RNA polymerase sigma-70 factor (ECF subfamily)